MPYLKKSNHASRYAIASCGDIKRKHVVATGLLLPLASYLAFWPNEGAEGFRLRGGRSGLRWKCFALLAKHLHHRPLLADGLFRAQTNHSVATSLGLGLGLFFAWMLILGI